MVCICCMLSTGARALGRCIDECHDVPGPSRHGSSGDVLMTYTSSLRAICGHYQFCHARCLIDVVQAAGPRARQRHVGITTAGVRSGKGHSPVTSTVTHWLCSFVVLLRSRGHDPMEIMIQFMYLHHQPPSGTGSRRSDALNLRCRCEF